MSYRAHPPAFIVEGNIGAGKSTFLRKVGEALDVQLVYEPHHKWQNVGGAGNLLDNFYRDTQRWAYTFQTYAFITRIMEQELATKTVGHRMQVLERSVYSDRYCFAKTAAQIGTMAPLEWQLYQELFVWLVGAYAVPPAGFIYIQTSPEVCYERLVKRSRSEEKSVSYDYLKTIHEKHERWLIDKEELLPQLNAVPVLVLDGNKDFENDPHQMAEHNERIAEFMRTCTPGNGLEFLTTAPGMGVSRASQR